MLKQTVRSLHKRLGLAGKTVLLRTDFNVPLSKDGSCTITDDTRIRGAVPTIEFLQQAQAKIVICSHLGRPKGRVVESMRLTPIATRLSELLGSKISKSDDCIGSQTQAMIAKLANGECLLLENVRFHAEEEANDEAFAKEMAKSVDVYVNDAFGTAHRAHASTAGVTQFVEHSVAGELMQRELEYLESAVSESPKRPLIAVIGGAKVSTKFPVLNSLLRKCDKVLLGGGMIFTFYKAMGYAVGDSIVEEEQIEMAKDLLANEKFKEKLVFPSDIVIADAFAADANTRVIDIRADNGIPDGWLGLDIGPKTIDTFAEELKDSHTIVWNGPMGVFEFEQFAKGTTRVAEILADCTQLHGATTIIGGGDSVAAVTQAGLASKISHISTGGGASLELLEGKTLPGVVALDNDWSMFTKD